MARGDSDGSTELAEVLTGGVVCYQIYETQNGGHVTLGSLEPQFWAAFCQAVGREDLLGKQFEPAVPGEPVYEQLCTLFRTRTRQEWVEALTRMDACCEPVYTVAEALESAPVQALGMLGGAGLLPPVRLSAQDARPSDAAPTLGQHTTSLLAELGYDAATVEELREHGVV